MHVTQQQHEDYIDQSTLSRESSWEFATREITGRQWVEDMSAVPGCGAFARKLIRRNGVRGARRALRAAFTKWDSY